jgi:glycosyltransferase involved in cell wall biosynthesis
VTNIAFFEPAYAAHNQRDWEIRGSYKYPSLLGDLHERASITLLMRDLPPGNDEHRKRLETAHGVRFAKIDALEDAGQHAAEMLAADYGAAIDDHAPDIVSTLNGRMIGYNYALARAARETGVDYVYRIAGNDIATQIAVQEAQGRPVTGTAFLANLMAQERYAAEAARTVIVMGGTERERAKTLVSDPSKIRMCRRGVDRTHFTPPAGKSERCHRILFVGRNSEEKGIDLIEAAAAMLSEERPGLSFTIAGDFEEREEGNRRYLGFHGYDALPDLYRDHHALLLPARSEGFPQVVMEAMTCGLPAILSQCLFSEDFGLEDGVALVDLDPRAIADAILRWHDDPALYGKCREKALGHAAAHFDAAANGALYHQALLGEVA